MQLKQQLDNASNIDLLSAVLGSRKTAEALLRKAHGSLFSLFHDGQEAQGDLFVAQGIKPYCGAATRLHAARELAARAIKEELITGLTLNNPEKVKEFLTQRIAGLGYEVFIVLFLDAQNRLIECVEMFRGAKIRKLPRRKAFETTKIFLPSVNWVDAKDARPLDYERDILFHLDWTGIDLNPLVAKLPMVAHEAQTRVTRLTIAGTTHADLLKAEQTSANYELASFDSVFATRVISDIVPNPWTGRELVGTFMAALLKRGFTESKMGAMSGFLLEEFRRFLLEQRDRLAEAHFMAKVASENIQFRLRTDSHNWQMPKEMETDRPATAAPLVRAADGALTEKSVFAPVYRDDFKNDEAEFACYLDEQKALQWWHRNVAKAGHYFLQGWRKNRVYPDFIFALQQSKTASRLVVWETKGDQLEGNLDTNYKRKLIQTMSGQYRFQNVKSAGKLDLVLDDQTTVSCDLVLMSEWKVKAPLEIQRKK